ncbi:glycosyltransferase [Megalodesulfovibrio paquesii]
MFFKHIIITRFNVHITPTPFAPRLGDTWLAERFRMFHAFCWPSIRAQTNQDFVWLVLFDEQTPPQYRRLISTFSSYRNFTPLFCGEYASIMPQLRAQIARIHPETEYILTTRLDNDDALANNFVAVLHRIVDSLLTQQPAPDIPLYINFPHGIQYCKGKVYYFSDVTNAFVSLLERNDPLRTVFWVDHPAIYDKAPVAQVETPPIFLQHVHDINVYNYIRGPQADDNTLLANFTISPPPTEPTVQG